MCVRVCMAVPNIMNGKCCAGKSVVYKIHLANMHVLETHTDVKA